MTDILPDGTSVVLGTPIEREKMNLVHMRLFDNQGRSPVPLAERHKTVTIAAETPAAVVISSHRPEGATRVDVQCLKDIYLRYDGDTEKVMEGKGLLMPGKYICFFQNEAMDNLVFGPPADVELPVAVELYFY